MNMNLNFQRRDFLKGAALTAGLSASFPGFAQRKRNLKIGHTGITWLAPRPAAGYGAPPARGGGPRPLDPAYIDQIFKDISSLGFYGLELISNQVQGMDVFGGLVLLFV